MKVGLKGMELGSPRDTSKHNSRENNRKNCKKKYVKKRELKAQLHKTRWDLQQAYQRNKDLRLAAEKAEK